MGKNKKDNLKKETTGAESQNLGDEKRISKGVYKSGMNQNN